MPDPQKHLYKPIVERFAENQRVVESSPNETRHVRLHEVAARP
jgi:hypothetical protein